MFSVKLQHVLVPREKDGSDVEDKGFEFEALLGCVCVCVNLRVKHPLYVLLHSLAGSTKYKLERCLLQYIV